MKTIIVLLATLVLAGCASTGTVYTTTHVRTTEVVRTVPVAVGVYTSSRIFGGSVSYMPHPYYYIYDGVNHDSRYFYNNARRNVYYKARPPYPVYNPHPRDRRHPRDKNRRR